MNFLFLVPLAAMALSDEDAMKSFQAGCKSHPATIAPVGSNRSNHGGNEVAEAFGKRVANG